MDSITNHIISKPQKNYVAMENRTNTTDDEKAAVIISITVSICAGVAFQSIPFSDIFILTPVQVHMSTRIAAVRGIPITKNDVLPTVKKISGVAGSGLPDQKLASGAYKTGLPGSGNFMTLLPVFGPDHYRLAMAELSMCHFRH